MMISEYYVKALRSYTGLPFDFRIIRSPATLETLSSLSSRRRIILRLLG
jgi:hypothetical protein